jgi:hypothetical protein
MTTYFIGILWGTQFLFALHFVTNETAKKLLVATMYGVVVLFVLTQLFNGFGSGLLLEMAMLLLQIGLIFLAQKRDFRFLALAFLIHGLWDLTHILKPDLIIKPLEFSQLCVPYDWIVSGYILYRNWKYD